MSAEIQTSPRAPDGWQLVPVEPTSDMARRFAGAYTDHCFAIAYTAMLAAAPAAPAESGALAALDASWRATLARERAIHLNEVRLKDEYRTRALAAEAELAKFVEMAKFIGTTG